MQLITNYGPSAVCVLALDIRADGQWCDFHARCNLGAYEDGRPKHSATWLARSSFGIFGHWWEGMGEPFDKFIAGCDPGYVLGKIGQKVYCERTILTSLNRAIFTGRATKEEKKAAAQRLKELAREYRDEPLCDAVYQDPTIGKCIVEWSDLRTMDWEPAAVNFVKRLWPAIVAEVGRKMEEWRAQTTAAAG